MRDVVLPLAVSWVGFFVLAAVVVLAVDRRQKRAARLAERRMPAAVVHELEPYRAARVRSAERVGGAA